LPANGEVGCTLSHIRLCDFLAKEGAEFSVIFEDDVIPLVDAATLGEVLEVAQANRLDIVILGYSKMDDREERLMNKVNPIRNIYNIDNGRYSIGKRYKESTVGTVAYAVSRRAAERLGSLNRPFHLADDWQYMESLGLSIFHLNPLGFREDYQGMTSE